MQRKLFGLVLFAIVFSSIGFSAEAFAANSRVDLYSIMETYQNKVEKAKVDFLSTVKKINADARESVKKGVLSTGEINAKTKDAMQDARDLFKSTIQQARQDAKESLYQLKASIDQPIGRI